MELNKKGLPFFPELRFEDKRHIYTLGGQILPSVTTVMKPLDEALYRGIDESVMQMAAERGTAIHNAAENFALYGIEDIEPRYAGYFEAFLKFWEEKYPEPLATESRVYHKFLRYAGTADLPCVIDGKTDQFEGEGGTHTEFIEGLMSTDMRKTADDLACYMKNCV